MNINEFLISKDIFYHRIKFADQNQFFLSSSYIYFISKHMTTLKIYDRIYGCVYETVSTAVFTGGLEYEYIYSYSNLMNIYIHMYLQIRI